MDLIQRHIQVGWELRVFFTEDVFSSSNPTLESALAAGEPRVPRKVLVILEASLAAARPKLAGQIEDWFAAGAVSLTAPPMLIAGGEEAKNSPERVQEIHSAINRHHLDRHSYLIAVGGGALLDVAGFAAATTHRGVRHVRIPTTVLSQADSGVGVKNGLNAFGKKNFIGTFAPPHAVINDFNLLATLEPRDKRAGYVEAVKVACIRDPDFFAALERDAEKLTALEPAAMKQLIRRCAELHLDHIATSGDPFETGSARPLDFGHWAAHTLEQLSHFRIRHGEAVAIGIALDVLYSRNTGLLNAAAADRILKLLERLGFQLFADELLESNSAGRWSVLSGLEEFREHLGGQLTITLLKEIGQGVEVHEMDPRQVIAAIRELRERRHETDAAPKMSQP